MRLEHEVSYKEVKVAVFYHVGNGKSLKDMGNGLGVEEDGSRKITVLIQVRNDRHLTKIVVREIKQSRLITDTFIHSLT